MSQFKVVVLIWEGYDCTVCNLIQENDMSLAST